MIGRLVLSDRNIFKIKSLGKNVTARKCLILSESHNEILIKSSKEFNPKDDYVKIDPISNTIIEGFGQVGIRENDLGIYYHLYTLGWMSKSKYNRIWDKIDTNYDLATNRVEYLNKVITIDPAGSIDLDDGFSFSSDQEYYYLDIHIADPVSYFDLANPTMIKILQELFTRLQTCYINLDSSNGPTHLLPESIVKLVSLLEINLNLDNTKQSKRAITFCFKILKNTLEIEFELKFSKLINIKNYSYEKYDEEINLDSNIEIKTNLTNMTNDIIKIMGVNIEPIELNTDISHRMIEVFMLLTNWYGGNYLINNLSSNKTIIRVQNKNELSDELDDSFDILEVPIYARPILSKAANYSIPNKLDENNFHYTLGISNYAHISSPMRRFIDMINHFGFYQIDLCEINKDLESYYQIDIINEKIKKYKKISNGFDLVKFISLNPTSNRFKACLFDYKKINTNTIKCMLVLYQSEHKFTKVVNVELPQIDLTFDLKKFMEFDVELYYNPNNFKSNKFPFSIKVI